MILQKRVADYLTKRFVWHNPTDLPKDECYGEAQKVIGMVAEEIFGEIDDLIIGIDNCVFDERLDGDKGCIVLDMNENQYKTLKEKYIK